MRKTVVVGLGRGKLRKIIIILTTTSRILCGKKNLRENAAYVFMWTSPRPAEQPGQYYVVWIGRTLVFERGARAPARTATAVDPLTPSLPHTSLQTCKRTSWYFFWAFKFDSSKQKYRPGQNMRATALLVCLVAVFGYSEYIKIQSVLLSTRLLCCW